MKRFNSLKDMREANVPPTVLTYVERICDDPVTDPSVAEDFGITLGGEVLIVECREDLAEISLLEESKLPVEEQHPNAAGWASPLERATSMDMAGWIEGGEWAILWMGTNNAGGPTYFVPKFVVDQEPNVIEIMKQSSEDGEPQTFNLGESSAGN